MRMGREYVGSRLCQSIARRVEDSACLGLGRTERVRAVEVCEKCRVTLIRTHEERKVGLDSQMHVGVCSERGGLKSKHSWIHVYGHIPAERMRRCFLIWSLLCGLLSTV